MWGNAETWAPMWVALMECLVWQCMVPFLSQKTPSVLQLPRLLGISWTWSRSDILTQAMINLKSLGLLAEPTVWPSLTSVRSTATLSLILTAVQPWRYISTIIFKYHRQSKIMTGCHQIIWPVQEINFKASTLKKLEKNLLAKLGVDFWSMSIIVHSCTVHIGIWSYRDVNIDFFPKSVYRIWKFGMNPAIDFFT